MKFSMTGQEKVWLLIQVTLKRDSIHMKFSMTLSGTFIGG